MCLCVEAVCREIKKVYVKRDRERECVRREKVR